MGLFFLSSLEQYIALTGFQSSWPVSISGPIHHFVCSMNTMDFLIISMANLRVIFPKLVRMKDSIEWLRRHLLNIEK